MFKLNFPFTNHLHVWKDPVYFHLLVMRLDNDDKYHHLFLGECPFLINAFEALNSPFPFFNRILTENGVLVHI
jgi:hypothetical protein